MPAGFQEVPAASLESTLATLGVRSTVLLFEGNTLTVSDKVFAKPRTNSDGTPVLDANGQTVLTYYILVNIDGKVDRPIPLGTFRRVPRDVSAFLDGHPLQQECYQADSYLSLFNVIKGKTLKVENLAEGDTIDWSANNGTGRTPSGDWVFKKAKFPHFVEVK